MTAWRGTYSQVPDLRFDIDVNCTISGEPVHIRVVDTGSGRSPAPDLVAAQLCRNHNGEVVSWCDVSDPCLSVVVGTPELGDGWVGVPQNALGSASLQPGCNAGQHQSLLYSSGQEAMVRNGDGEEAPIPRTIVVIDWVPLAAEVIHLITGQMATSALFLNEIDQYLAPMVAGSLRNMNCVSPGVQSNARRASQLNQRQRTLLHYLRHGLRTKQMARELSVSVATIKRDLTHIYATYGVMDRIEFSARFMT